MDDKKLNFVKIMDRVAIIMEIKLKAYPYDKNIADELGLSPTQYANNKARNKIPYEEISIFCDKHQITINWVLFGRSSIDLIRREEEVYKIRVIENINASCGGGGYDNDNAKKRYIAVDMLYAQKLGIVNSKNIEALKVIGDSMIPTIKENSVILLDRDKNKMIENEVFVVNTNDGLFVKRLRLNGKYEIDLISDNDIYTKVSMKISEVKIIGRVIGSLEKDSGFTQELITVDMFMSLENRIDRMKNDIDGLAKFLQDKGIDIHRAAEMVS